MGWLSRRCDDKRVAGRYPDTVKIQDGGRYRLIPSRSKEYDEEYETLLALEARSLNRGKLDGYESNSTRSDIDA